MVFLSLIAIVILGFFLLSIFDRQLRDKVVDFSRANVDNLFRKAPVFSDEVIIDPLNEEIRKFTAGRTTGGINIGKQQTKEFE